MSIIRKAAVAVQTALGTDLDQLGRDTGAIRRQRKFSGCSLLRTLVLTLLKDPAARREAFVATAAQLGVIVTPRAIAARFDDRLLAFLRKALERTIAQALAASPRAIPLLEKFTAVTIADSTSISLPDCYRDEFPGCGSRSGGGAAAVKLQVAFELRSGRLSTLVPQGGSTSDASANRPDEPVAVGSLTIRDLGYFDLRWFRRVGQRGAYWISRLQQGTRVYDAAGAALDLVREARGHAGRGPVDRLVEIGEKERLACRLILLPVPPEVAARRKRKAHERAVKHGRTPSAESLAWCEFTVLVTNCPAELLSWKEVVVLYRSRWQIELMFKLWKSHNHLASFRPEWTASERMAIFWAKLIGVVLQHWLLLTSTWSQPGRSPWRAAQEIRRWIVTLTESLNDVELLERGLERMVATIAGIAQQKRRKRSPGLFQLLLDPELLNWNS